MYFSANDVWSKMHSNDKVELEYSSQGVMCYYWRLVFKHDGKYYKVILDYDGEDFSFPMEGFEADEVVAKEIKKVIYV